MFLPLIEQSRISVEVSSVNMSRLTRGKAIRAKWLDCCCGDRIEVKLCPVTKCPLWIYRLGKEVDADIDSEVQNGTPTHQN